MKKFIFLILFLTVIACCAEKEEMSLSEALKYKKPVIAEFYSKTCIICKKVHEELDKIKKEFGDRIIIVRLDVSKKENILMLQYYNRELTVPTIVIFDRYGKEHVVLKGYVDYNTLKKYILEVI